MSSLASPTPCLESQDSLAEVQPMVGLAKGMGSGWIHVLLLLAAYASFTVPWYQEEKQVRHS